MGMIPFPRAMRLDPLRLLCVACAAWLVQAGPAIAQEFAPETLPPELRGLPMPGTVRGPADPETLAHYARVLAPLERMGPVTSRMLLDPPPGDWLHWRRSYDGSGYSPLKQINRGNVRHLRVAWAWGMNSTGVSEFAPLVHDGVMFLWNYGETIQALDARTGSLLWQYKYKLPGDLNQPGFFRTKRNLAIGGNKLIVPTTDMHVLALDIKTGKVLWNVTDADYHTKLTYNSGALVIRDKVLVGASGCAPGFGQFPPGGCFIVAHDLETGRELWRFNTVAHPGEPGGDTWNDLPLETRAGASVWTTGSYDAALNLSYWGTGGPWPWSAIDRGTWEPAGGPGTTRDLLYTDSTLAINPDTGQLAWHYQHLANDTFDQDYAFERLVAPVTLQGKSRKAVITVGKPGIFEALDAATGEFLFARDPGAQTVVKSLDVASGARTLLEPKPPAGVTRCPGNDGTRSFPAGAYDPATRRYYLAIDDGCSGKSKGAPGRLLALDLDTQAFAWDIHSRLPLSSAALTTAGGLLFYGSPDRYFRAYDDRDGKVLWETRVQDVPKAFPITYMVDGRQYIAMVVGNPGIGGQGRGKGTPDGSPDYSTSVLWVWELP